MTPKEKADKLYQRAGYYCTTGYGVRKTFSRQKAVDMAMDVVNEIRLQAKNWGVISVKRYWDEVENELKNKI